MPARASAKWDRSLVADQDPADMYQKFLAHLQAVTAEMKEVRFTVTSLGDMAPSRTSPDRPEAQAVIRAVRRAYGTEPVVMPSLGGSLPDCVWTRILGVPSVVVPYANPDEDNHAPNENIALDCFFNGIRCATELFVELGGLRSPKL